MTIASTVTAIAISDPSPPVTGLRALAIENLHELARPIPAAWLVDQVLTSHGKDGFGISFAAIEAVGRRLEMLCEEKLRVASRPSGRSSFGLRTMRRPRASARPYSTVLRSLEPLEASCGCADLLANSLGLCRHVLTVLAELARSAGRPRQRPSLSIRRSESPTWVASRSPSRARRPVRPPHTRRHPHGTDRLHHRVAGR